jgi:hypothetical protein
MAMKKAREHRFTIEDANGKLRVVHLHIQHHQDDAEDRVALSVTTDGLKVDVDTFVEPIKIVKTKSRM